MILFVEAVKIIITIDATLSEDYIIYNNKKTEMVLAFCCNSKSYERLAVLYYISDRRTILRKTKITK